MCLERQLPMVDHRIGSATGGEFRTLGFVVALQNAIPASELDELPLLA